MTELYREQLGVRSATRVLRSLLPPFVEVEETTGDSVADSPFVAERAVVERAVAKRRAEFFTVRDCARRALERLGQPAVPIVPGAHREPLWPEGIVGSLTHCDGYRAAAVGRAQRVVTIGVDAEPHGPLPEGVGEIVASDTERDHLASLTVRNPEMSWDRVLFSVKESVFKAWFPLTRGWLDFSECEVSLDPTGTFAADLLVRGPIVDGRRIEGFTGRWTVQDNLVVTAICVPRA